MIRQIITTEDGSHTFYVPELGEHYHSIHGAVQESMHIFIGKGLKEMHLDQLSILEVGFGTGLNALLTMLEAGPDISGIFYEGWEAYPLLAEEAADLNYPAILRGGDDLLPLMHASAWGVPVRMNAVMTLLKVKGDIRDFHSDRKFDLVYFDAFGPDYLPELWDSAVFDRIYLAMREGSRLVTYSAKGQVRRNMRQAGFRIEKAPGPPGKREMTIAHKS